jgi:hypothetical protein|tara:strand:+ start:1410 stop:1565 length:156 start_codon:yes stop_codon:yes gene_type:complete
MIIEYANTLEDFDNQILSGEVEVPVSADNIQGINDWLDANVDNLYDWKFKE